MSDGNQKGNEMKVFQTLNRKTEETDGLWNENNVLPDFRSESFIVNTSGSFFYFMRCKKSHTTYRLPKAQRLLKTTHELKKEKINKCV